VWDKGRKKKNYEELKITQKVKLVDKFGEVLFKKNYK
jgi:hypothetical protein